MFYNYKVVGKKKSLVDYDFFKFYSENSKHRKAGFLARDLATVMSSIYKKVSESIVEYEGGVYAREMFYIIPQPYPDKAFIKVTNGYKFRGTMNLHTEGKIYGLLFVNLFPGYQNKVWDMYNSFHRKLKRTFSKFLKNNKPTYKFSLHSIFKTRAK